MSEFVAVLIVLSAGKLGYPRAAGLKLIGSELAHASASQLHLMEAYSFRRLDRKRSRSNANGSGVGLLNLVDRMSILSLVHVGCCIEPESFASKRCATRVSNKIAGSE